MNTELPKLLRLDDYGNCTTIVSDEEEHPDQIAKVYDRAVCAELVHRYNTHKDAKSIIKRLIGSPYRDSEDEFHSAVLDAKEWLKSGK